MGDVARRGGGLWSGVLKRVFRGLEDDGFGKLVGAVWCWDEGLVGGTVSNAVERQRWAATVSRGASVELAKER